MSKSTIQTYSFALEGEGLPTQLPAIPGGDTIVGRDGRGFKFSNPEKVLKQLNKLGRPIQLDVNHSSVLKAPMGGDSEAMAWLSDWQVGPDGSLFAAKVEWTPVGKELMSRGGYRYLSPALKLSGSGEVVGLHSLALTNNPNLAELPALNSSEEMMFTPEQLKQLGLEELATAEQIVEKFSALEKTAKEVKDQAAMLSDVKGMITALEATVKEATSKVELNHSKDEVFQIALNAVLDRATSEGKLAPNAEAKSFYVAATKDMEALKALQAHFGQAKRIAGKSDDLIVSLNNQKSEDDWKPKMAKELNLKVEDL